MSPRERKVAVPQGLREEWLKRNEQGDTPPMIAQADGFDVRTVRKYLDIARQERESKEARYGFLRDSLQHHYADLCRCAEKLGGRYSGRVNEFSARTGSEVPYQAELESALRQHIPRSLIWSLLNRQNELHKAQTELTRALDRKIEDSVTADSVLQAKLTPDETGVIPGLIIMLKSQANQWAQGLPGLNPRDALTSKPVENSLVELNYGVYSMGRVREGHVEAVNKTVQDWMAQVKGFEEYRQLEKIFTELPRVEQKLQKEIAGIVLRRVVPGRCSYCPI